MTRAEIESRARAPYAEKIRAMMKQQDAALDAILKCRAALFPYITANQEAMDAYNATTTALLALDRT